MEQRTYEIEAAVERDHWWFRGRRRILSGLLDGLRPGLAAGARVLDVGCGTGANGPALASRGRFVVGVDRSAIPLALDGTGGRGHAVRLRADAARLPFRAHGFDAVVALDVLEHLDDDFAALRELHRVLRPGGVLVVFVPALPVLWGLQDDVSHHRRRYRRVELETLIARSGFLIERLTYFNTVLFAPILAARLAMRVLPPRTLASENEIGGPLTSKLLGALFAAEAPFLAHLDLPIGVSLACVARRG